MPISTFLSVHDYDSIMTHPQPAPLMQNEFYVGGEGLPDLRAAGQLRVLTEAENGWVVAAMLVMLALLVATLVRNRHYVAYRMKEFFSTQRQFANVGIGNSPTAAANAVLLIGIGCAAAAIVLHARFVQYDVAALLPDLPGAAYLALWLALAIAVLLKASAYGIVNWVFFDRGKSRRWMSAFFFLTAVFSCLVFGIATLHLFSDFCMADVSKCSLFLLISYEILVFYKLITNFQPKKYGILLIFLYFCSVEIAPLLAIGHFFAQNGGAG